MIDAVAVQLDAMLARMCGEFLEMPGLCLTCRQAQRLWGLDEPTCAFLLNILVDSGFLRLTRNGTFTRASDGPAAAPRVRTAISAPNSFPAR